MEVVFMVVVKMPPYAVRKALYLKGELKWILLSIAHYWITPEPYMTGLCILVIGFQAY